MHSPHVSNGSPEAFREDPVLLPEGCLENATLSISSYVKCATGDSALLRMITKKGTLQSVSNHAQVLIWNIRAFR